MALLSRHSSPVAEPELILVTGEPGIGKTTWCLALMRQALADGVEPVGLISPAVFEGGIKTGIDLLHIATGERRRLAMKPGHETSISFVPTGAARLGWLFDHSVLAWGNQVLQGLPPSRLLILDELGPLELLENTGFTAGIEQIQRQSFRLTCVSVRPKLLSIALERWPWARVLTLSNPATGSNQV